MVNSERALPAPTLSALSRLVTAYVVVVAATLVALVVLSLAGSAAATDDAWVHALVVGVLAVLLPVRLRAARRGSSRAVVAVGIIATVLLVANLVEAVVPGLFPAWMRVEMLGTAALMAAIVVLVVRGRR